MKRNILETLQTPIHGEDVKRVLITPVFSRKTSDPLDVSAPEQTPYVQLRSQAQGLRLAKSRYYALGPSTVLVQLTFESNIELIELLPLDEQASVSARLWDSEGWPTEVHLHFGAASRAAPIVLKDFNGKHVYFTLITDNPKGRTEHPLAVLEARADAAPEDTPPDDSAPR